MKNEEDSSAQVADPEEHAQVQTALQRQTHFRTYYNGMVSVIENALVSTDPDTEEIIYRCNGGAVVEILFASSTSQAQMKLLIWDLDLKATEMNKEQAKTMVPQKKSERYNGSISAGKRAGKRDWATNSGARASTAQGEVHLFR